MACAIDGLLALPPIPVKQPQRGEHTAEFWRRAGRQAPDWLAYQDAWHRSREDGRSPLEDAMPWMTFPAIAFLQTALQPEHRVFEWGSGGSTRFFRSRAAYTVTVEHDPVWERRASEAISGVPRGEFHLIEPQPGGADEKYASGVAQYAGLSFRSYVSFIGRFPERSFDLVAIDGRARMACLAAALPRVKPGGYVILDNANYPRYQTALAALRAGALAQWREIDLSGPGPYSRTAAWTTTAWQNPVA